MACAILSLSVSAQNTSSSSSSSSSKGKSELSTTFGIRAGLTLANQSIEVGGTSVSPDNRTTFHIGIIADIPMTRNFYIETGLFLQNKGFKMTDAKNNKLTCKPLYLEFPVLASCRLKLSDAMQLQLNAGPYIAHGLGGKAELRSSDGHASIENDVFYREGNRDYIPVLLKEYGTVACEMESFALFHNAKVLNKKAACLVTISDSMVTYAQTSAEERQNALTNMIPIALEAPIAE